MVPAKKVQRVERERAKEDSRATDDKKGNSASGVQGGTAATYVFFGSHLATPVTAAHMAYSGTRAVGGYQSTVCHPSQPSLGSWQLGRCRNAGGSEAVAANDWPWCRRLETEMCGTCWGLLMCGGGSARADWLKPVMLIF